MTDGSDVKKYIKHKKKKRSFKKIVIVFIVVASGTTVFITKAPMFNISSIELNGVAKSDEGYLQDSLSPFVGKNIFMVNTKEIENVVRQNKYFKDVKISREGTSTLSIDIEKEAPVYYVSKDNTYYILNEQLEILEKVTSIEGRDLVQVLGVNVEGTEIGEYLSGNIAYQQILKAFYPYIAQNKESIELSYLDLSDIGAIKGKIGNVDIMFGDESDIHNKMENVYRILLSDTINLQNGYIDVSFDGPPVIKYN